MRFLTAMLALIPGKWKLTGSERMQQRPLQPLTAALSRLGVEIAFEGRNGYPPLIVTGNPGQKGGMISLDAGISSQFISALMMIGPVLKGGLEIVLEGKIISTPYIRMTQALMQKAGAEVSFTGNKILIPECSYQDVKLNEIEEPDWSAAAFWYQVVALSKDAQILLSGLRKDSVQGDSVLPVIFTELGVQSVFTKEGLEISKSHNPANSNFNYDFTGCPDLAQPVIVCCAALGIKGEFSGLKTLRIKETDRIEAVRTELVKLGVGVEVIDDQIILDREPEA